MHDSLPILYSFRRCPYAMRARAALILLKIPVEVREISLAAKPDALLEISPKGTVPVLLLPTGRVLEESLDIMHWAMEQNGDSTLLPIDAAVRSQIEALIAQNDSEFKANLDRYKYYQAHSEFYQETWRDLCMPFLETLESLLEKASFLFGAHMTYGDLAILPFVRQFSRVDAQWFQTLDMPKLRAWLQAWLDSALCEQVMKKFPLWKLENAQRTLLL